MQNYAKETRSKRLTQKMNVIYESFEELARVTDTELETKVPHLERKLLYSGSLYQRKDVALKSTFIERTFLVKAVI